MDVSAGPPTYRSPRENPWWILPFLGGVPHGVSKTQLRLLGFLTFAMFFENYDLLLCPATIVAPFPIENRYVAECAGKKFDNYVEWLGIVYAITLVCCPALSLPCGFTASGLPVGLQVVAPPRGEAQLLAGSKVLEDILGLRGTTPIDPRAPK